MKGVGKEEIPCRSLSILKRGGMSCEIYEFSPAGSRCVLEMHAEELNLNSVVECSEYAQLFCPQWVAHGALWLIWVSLLMLNPL